MYDPLKHNQLSSGQAYPNSYWQDHYQPDFSATSLCSDVQADTVVIGAGYTGLMCAYTLAKDYGQNVVLLEANKIGWGCSGRNAGFVLQGSGRLSITDIENKFGGQVADQMYSEYQQSIDWINQLIDISPIDCQPQRYGYLKIAHNQRLTQSLQNQADYLNKRFGSPISYLNQDQVKDYLNTPTSHGALYTPFSFGVNPLKLATGYAKLAEQAGAAIHTDSSVQQIESNNGFHKVITDVGSVTAKKLVLATNGYTAKRFHPALDERSLPVLSSVIVTQPLTEEELAACGMTKRIQAMDTRALKYYYRLLPDNRILFGGRGAIQGKNANNPVFKERLLNALKETFPALAAIKAEYFWSGWISVSIDDLPRIWEQDKVYYSSGYCGSGVSFAAFAGKRMAQKVAGEKLPELPIYSSPLKRFPFAQFRRLGQWGFYQWARITDNI